MAETAASVAGVCFAVVGPLVSAVANALCHLAVIVVTYGQVKSYLAR